MRSAGYIQMRAALDGSFEYEVAAARGNVINAMGLAMEEVADELVGKLRYDFQASGMANASRLRRAAWRRDEIYGKGRSLDPAAWVYSKLPIIVSAFENGEVIRARGAKGFLIPNPEVWPGGRARYGRGRKVGDLWALATARFGQLRVVRRPGKTTLVVAEVRESAKRPGSYRKASAAALNRAAAGNFNGLQTVVVFVIARQFKQPRLLRGATIRARAAAEVPRRMNSLFLKYFASIGEGPRRISGPARREWSSADFASPGGPRAW